MPDFQAGQWRAAEFVNSGDQIEWMQREREFLAETARPKSEKQGKRKQRKP